MALGVPEFLRLAFSEKEITHRTPFNHAESMHLAKSGIGKFDIPVFS
jgi:hypothetical protein